MKYKITLEFEVETETSRQSVTLISLCNNLDTILKEDLPYLKLVKSQIVRTDE